ncbi:3-methyladenine DNA glycosylase [Nitratiruptor tergarcus]|uniref:DNA-3-methyladenine glycosylase III n=1 Tax=Nitratiruptor tergarcus DSM 16512 TaxID=1069081 RepID=A0A1W1WPW9_9BACT|nr:3-methyladenine DNA glycosylase [Nitratiruptor tergarcus]SMC08265.1 DNA-3-methyladenine glycosylase III [Nitratiruptor tergarcus DSM 16512]
MIAYELIKRLKELGYIKDERDPYWWPKSGSFEVVIGAVLTQNTKWENVEKALENLRNTVGGEIAPEKIVAIEQKRLAELIKPAGFYNTKAFRIQKLVTNMLEEYGSFEAFAKRPSRSWLLSQKGIGFETADSILNYACYRDFLVVDAYTAKIMRFLGYEFETYSELQEFLSDSIIENLDRIYDLYDKELPLAQIYARFHGKIVEFCKDECKGKNREEKIRKLLSY